MAVRCERVGDRRRGGARRLANRRSPRPGRPAAGVPGPDLPHLDLARAPAELSVRAELQRLRARGVDGARRDPRYLVDPAPTAALRSLAPWGLGPGSTPAHP